MAIFSSSLRLRTTRWLTNATSSNDEGRSPGGPWAVGVRGDDRRWCGDEFAASQGRDSIAIFGVGPVGMSAVLAAVVCKCAPIIAVDIHEGRLKAAKEMALRTPSMPPRRIR